MKNEKYIIIISLLFFGILYTVSKFFYGNNFSASFAIGWAVSFFNFIGVMIKVRSSFKSGRFGSVVFNTQVRLLVTGAVLYYWFKSYEVNIFGLLVGLTSIAVSIPLSIFFSVKEE